MCGDVYIHVLTVFMFQENKSFGASTICIHPLMYEAVSGTVMIQPDDKINFIINQMKTLNEKENFVIQLDDNINVIIQPYNSK
jgi:hypothetical protein